MTAPAHDHQGGDAHHGGHGRSRGHHHGAHAHGPRRGGDQRWLVAALALLVALLAGEVVAGLVARSMALLADAGHLLADAGALGLSVWALRLAARPARGTMTYGLQRAEVLSALANGVTLLVVAAILAVGALSRLVHPAPTSGGVVVAVAAVGLVVNLAATALAGRADRSSLNVAGALAHLATDAWAAGAALAAGVAILATGWTRADALASLTTVALTARAGWSLSRAAGRVLLEGAPEDVDLAELRRHLLELPWVEGVHDLHAWVVTSDLPAVSAHVVVGEGCFASGAAPGLLDQLQACLAGHFDVTHSTFQVELPGHADHEVGQHS